MSALWQGLLALRRLVTIPLFRLLKGFLLLYLMALPFLTLLVLYVGIMGAGAPNADAVQAFLVVGTMFFLGPIALFVLHLVLAKVFDTFLLLAHPLKWEITWIGLAACGLLLVVAGNVFVDDLYQWRQGNILISVIALFLDLAALGIVALVGLIPIPFLDRLAAGRSGASPQRA